MEDFLKVNPQQICFVRSYFKSRCRWYEYREESGWIWKDPAGFYDCTGLTPYLADKQVEQNKCLYVEDKIVYYKPHVELIMSNKEIIEKYFNTEQELLDFMNNEPMNHIPWVNREMLI